MDPDQFAGDKPKCMEYEPISALIQGFEPFLEARILIQIRLKVKGTIWFRIRIKVTRISNTKSDYELPSD